LSPQVIITDELATSPGAQACLSLYYRELDSRFANGFDPARSVLSSLDDFAPPRGAFLVMRLRGEPVGCGGLTPLGEKAVYLKRMCITPKVRGLGLGRRLLAALEEKARDLGYGLVRLETNEALIEAQQLYRSAGYREVPPFNDEHYAHHWFEKSLSDGCGGSSGR
jgi:GNAT superfamily N-acetyltransferase